MTQASVTPPTRAAGLPRIHPAAWHGPIGEAVCRIAPTTEADPVAVLAQTLALFGALAGDGLHTRIGGMRHPARIWPLIVGKTGSGRKGTSWAEARGLARQWNGYTEAYCRHRILSGLSSGEGLLAALGAGQSDAGDPDREPIAPDGRLTVAETEFARVLAAAKRDGNTLGPVLRQLWDEGTAGVATRTAPLRVEDAHVGMVAHITPRELRLKLAESDIAGGTLNRFLLIASERPHLLPHEPDHPHLGGLSVDIGKAVDQARASGALVRRDREAEKLWPDVYAALSAEEPDGALGAVLARGPAYTMRLALVYALADGSTTINKQHLTAGLALWQYSAQSARMVFVDAQTRGDEHRLATFLAATDAGRTRQEVSAHFARNRTAAQLDTMLDLLERRGKVRRTTDASAGGRSATRYWWTGDATDPITVILDLNA